MSKKEYYSNKKPQTAHIRHVRMSGDTNNNKMERFNGEIRDREKTMRGIKKADTAILTGYQLYHNYFREHEGLAGKDTGRGWLVLGLKEKTSG